MKKFNQIKNRQVSFQDTALCLQMKRNSLECLEKIISTLLNRLIDFDVLVPLLMQKPELAPEIQELCFDNAEQFFAFAIFINPHILQYTPKKLSDDIKFVLQCKHWWFQAYNTLVCKVERTFTLYSSTPLRNQRETYNFEFKILGKTYFFPLTITSMDGGKDCYGKQCSARFLESNGKFWEKEEYYQYLDQKVVRELVAKKERDFLNAARQHYANNGTSFAWASDKLRKNREFVKENWWLLQGAHNELRNDKIYIEEMLAKDPQLFERAGDQLRKDKEYIKELVKKYPDIALHIHPDLLKGYYFDDEFLGALLPYNGGLIEIIADHYKNWWPSFECADESLRKSRALVKKFPNLLQYAHNDLRCDKAFIIEMIQMDCSYFEKSALRNDKDYIKELVIKYPQVAGYIVDKDNADFLCEMVQINPEVFSFFQTDLRHDGAFIDKLWTEFNPLVLLYVDVKYFAEIAEEVKNTTLERVLKLRNMMKEKPLNHAIKALRILEKRKALPKLPKVIWQKIFASQFVGPKSSEALWTLLFKNL